MIREGAKVSFVGDDERIAVGARGKVVSSSGTYGHVLWATGSLAGQITPHHEDDLVVGASLEAVAHDLHSDSLVAVAVRDTYDMAGDAGLLNALNEEGHLATFSVYAEQALETVASAIRTDASMREVLGQLTEDEQSEFVAFTASVLLRDAFGGAEA